MKFILAGLIIFSSCTFKKNNQKLKGHEELYTEPVISKSPPLPPGEKRIVVASTNDIHGSYGPLLKSFQDDFSNSKQSIQVGGLEVIESYLKILKDTYKNVVLVDSGDIFGSGNNLREVQDFYFQNQYDAVTVGLRDFNIKVPSKYKNNADFFQSFARGSKVPLVLSNLYELKTARAVEWDGTKTHIIKEVDGVKIGIVGLIPDDIVAQTPINNRIGLFVENMLQSTLRHSRILRTLGADVIIVLTHQGISCGNELAEDARIPLKKVNFDPQRENVCNLSSSLGEYLSRLPRGLVDVVVGGRNHQKMANIINGVVVMGGFPDGESFNYVELVIDTKTNKLLPEKTVVHQPVMFCNEFFQETKDCYTEDSTVDHKKRIPATFLGRPVKPSAEAALPPRLRLQQNTSPVNVSQNLEMFGSDLSFISKGTGETQLISVQFKGDELLTLLEEDYNSGRKDQWNPSPFLVEEDDLIISINGESIDLRKSYRVLTDLETLQKHKKFLEKLERLEFEAFMHHSFLSLEEDEVNTQLAARSR